MARQRIDASLAALARRRADVSSAHFGLAFLMTEAGGLVAPAARPSSRLAMSVPKRQLKRAVDRNALKRVAREAWRLAPWGDCARPQVVMVKLRRSEAQWKTTGAASLKKAWRAELDQLFSSLSRRMNAQPVPNDRAAGQPASTEVTAAVREKNPAPDERPDA
ncbi:MAG TPA: ribonuclease P protein component [Quisquiliibacterium sp.]|nr:ribonuclease P protein component [Quisquiliibacterium sp.]